LRRACRAGHRRRRSSRRGRHCAHGEICRIHRWRGTSSLRSGICHRPRRTDRRRRAGAGGGRCARHNWRDRSSRSGRDLPLHQLTAEIALSIAFARIKNRERKGEEKENGGEPAGDLREDIGRLRAEDVLRHSPTESGAQAFAFRALHQNHEHHERRDEKVNPQEDVNQKAHWDGQYRQSQRFVNGRGSRTPSVSSRGWPSAPRDLTTGQAATAKL
jgi:hypothetical protein